MLDSTVKPRFTAVFGGGGGGGQGNIRGKSGSAVNQGFVWLTICMLSPIWGKGNGSGISDFECNPFSCISNQLILISPFISLDNRWPINSLS